MCSSECVENIFLPLSIVYIICNMICRRVAGLTSYMVCVDMVN
jgi:hypothetical protein